MHVRVVLACAAVALLVLAAPAARAQERQFALLSGGDAGPNVIEVRASEDGSAVFLVAADERYERIGLYRWRDGELALVFGTSMSAWRASPDGRRVLIETWADVPGAGDTDALADVYRVDANGVPRLLTGNRPASLGGHPMSLVDASADLSRVYVSTREDLAGDDDGQQDGFAIVGGTISLLTPSAGHADLHDVSDDGSVAWFSSYQDVPATGDGDGLPDVYRADRDGVRLVTGSRPAEAGGASAWFLRASPDGSGFSWLTSEDVPDTGDDDRLLDAYRTWTWSGGHAHQLLSGSNPRASGGRDLGPIHAISPDGGRVVFSTTESIPDTGDSDGLADLYRGGDSCFRGCESRFDPFARVPTLLTSAEAYSTGGRSVTYGSSSPDLSQVLFLTDEDVDRTGDDDGLRDGYRADGARVALLTGSRPAASGGAPVRELGMSRSGRFVFFGTDEDMPGTGDTDGLYDFYRRGLDGLVLLTGGRPLAEAGFPVQSPLLPTDDERFVFVTAESLVGDADTDRASDVYVSTPVTAPPSAAAPTGVPAPVPGAPAPAPSTAADSSAEAVVAADTVAPAFLRRLALRRGRLRFMLSEPATVTITVVRERPGRRVGGRCRTPTTRTARAPRCVRRVVVARLRHQSGAGLNRVAFTARVVARRRLGAGRYGAVAVARDAAGNASRPSRARFRLRAAGG